MSASRRLRERLAPRADAADAEGLRLVVRPTWWAHPAWIFLLCALPGPYFAARADDGRFVEVWGTPKYFGTSDLALSLLYIGVFCLVAALVAGRTSRTERGTTLALSGQQVRVLRAFSAACFWLLMLAYAVWALKAVLAGVGVSEVLGVLRGAPGAVSTLKRQAEPIAGVTTLTQLGPVIVAVNEVLRRGGVVRGVRLTTCAVVAFAAVRTLLYAERLALIEVLVPYAVVLFLVAPRRGRPVRQLLRVLAPVVAPLALLVFFGVFEHSRSWANYWEQKYTRGGYEQFVVDRVSGYYATSSNNSALILDGYDENLTLPYYTVKLVWSFPLVSSIFSYGTVTGFEPGPGWKNELGANANPEFNNEGGLLTPVADYGTVGAGLYWVLLGAAVGLCFRRARAGRVAGIVGYAVLFAGILEVGRICYWGTGRFFPTAVAALVLAHRLRALERAPEPVRLQRRQARSRALGAAPLSR